MKVLVVSGASGGHFFPSLSFLEALVRQGKDIQALLVVSEKIEHLWLEHLGFQVVFLPHIKVGLRSFREFFDFGIRFIRNAIGAFILLLHFRPDIVVGFGSIISVPLVWMAWFFRIKTIIHEQNVIPGRANRLLALFVDNIAISFKESESYFLNQKRKLVLTGNPLRSSLVKKDKKMARTYFGLAEDMFTILAMGGSQASHKINFALLEYIKSLPPPYQIQIIHLAGKQDAQEIENEYRRMGIRSRVFVYLQEMEFAFSAADLVISRAGAMSITEIFYFGLPAVLIPYPYAYQHQLANARVLEKKGQAIIIEEKELNNTSLSKAIEALRYAGFKEDKDAEFILGAAGRLANLTLGLI